MELKVWVDGIQRVVCGITDQTTVQEVVIALAQATGRTGRYTLVERWKTNEKMLPPAEHPLQLLSSWGDRASEVQFVLRRTGASTSMSESGDDKMIVPERTTHRSSLPPQLKHKQKKEAILNRKEPKRKSLDITGGAGGDSLGKYKARVVRNDNQDNNNIQMAAPRSPKKALMPPSLRNQTVSKQETNNSDKKKNLATPSSQQLVHQPLSPKKKALMPPILKADEKPQHNANSTRYIPTPFASHKRQYSGEDAKDITLQPVNVDRLKPASQTRAIESPKARAEFTRLVLEQHKHVQEQDLTLQSLDEEMVKCEAMAQRRQKSAAMLRNEIANLERTIEKNERDINNEKSLQELLQNEGCKGNSLQNENTKYELEIKTVSKSIEEMEKRIELLQQEIEREKAKKQEDFENRYISTESEVRKVNENISELLTQLKLVEDDIGRAEIDVNDKYLQLESLNRELRQVNLQQFIRQTGSKVTVLPPDADRGNFDSQAHNQRNDGHALNPSNSGESGGVWV